MSPMRLALALLACLFASVAGADTTRIYLEDDDLIQAMADRLATVAVEKDWPRVADYAQKLLDAPDDVLIQVKHLDRNGKPVTVWTSPHAEAERQLAALPAEAHEAYRKKHQEEAATLLAAATKAKDPEKIAEVVHRFLFTPAGDDALRWLAGHHLDRKRPLVSAMMFERVLQLVPIDRLSATDLYRATQAFRQAGDENNATKMWKKLIESADKDSLRIGEKRLTIKEWEAELAKLVPIPPASGWTMYRGNPTRSGQDKGLGPSLVRSWSVPTLSDPKDSLSAKRIAEAIEQAKALPESPTPINAIDEQERRISPPALPGSFPIAVGGLVIYRTHSGLQAVNLKDGSTAWTARSELSLELGLDSERTPDRRLKDLLEASVKQATRAERYDILLDNSLLGTLTTDGKYVYAVRDLQLPPLGMDEQKGVAKLSVRLAELFNTNRLQAFDLKTGNLRWEVGGRSTVDDNGPLEDGFFRGVPLPLGGRLHLLTEKQGELRYVTLDPRLGEVVRVRKLARVEGDLVTDPLRRMQAVHLAHGDGVLVCPTNAGAVYGIDPFSGAVLWAHVYRQKSPAAKSALTKPGWRTSAPAVVSGKVVIAPPDADSLYCLDLGNGQVLWKAERTADDLYFAGVCRDRVILVGSRSVRGLNLKDGTLAWQLQTGIPAGQGICGDSVYYLPLQSFRRTKKAEVCAIDVERGAIVAHIQAGENQWPGNLIFAEDRVISQTPTAVVAYPRLTGLLNDIDVRLKKDARDPLALLERAELKVDNGDRAGAIEDLRAAIEKNPPERVPDGAINLVYDLLTETLLRDFAANEKHLEFYRKLSELELAVFQRMPKEKVPRELRRRVVLYYAIQADGYLQQGKLEQALSAYLGLAFKELNWVGEMELPDRRLSATEWAAAGVAAVLNRASAEERKKLEKMLAERWEEIQKTKEMWPALRFVRIAGARSAVGREAALELADWLAQADKRVEVETVLLPVFHQLHDTTHAARALEAMARNLFARGLLEEAIELYRDLGRDFPKTKVIDGKTGADLWDEITRDRKLQPFLKPDRPKVRTFAVEEREGSTSKGLRYSLEPAGDLPAALRRWSVSFNLDDRRMELRDLITGQTRDAVRLTGSSTSWLGDYPSSEVKRFRYRMMGQLLLVPVEESVYAIDAVTGKALWDYILIDSPELTRSTISTSALTHEEGLWVYGRKQHRLGVPPLVLGSTIILPTDDGLTALDSLRNVLWQRPGIRADCSVFGDERHVYVVTDKTTRAFRVADGSEVAIPSFADLWDRRLTTLGRTVFIAESDKRAVVVRQYDVHTGEDLWRRTFPAGSLVAYTDEDHLGAVMEPGGEVTIFDLRQFGPVLQAKLDLKELKKAKGVVVLADASNWYVAINNAIDPADLKEGEDQANFVDGSGLRTTPINGMLFAFDRQTGKERWSVQVERQALLLNHFAEMPALMFANRVQRIRPDDPKKGWHEAVELAVIDKQTGKALYQKTNFERPGRFHTFNRNAKTGEVELIARGLTLAVVPVKP